MPLISLLLLLLPTAALLIWLLPRASQARVIALGAALVTLAAALAVLALFDPSLPGFQFVERASWIPTLGVQYLVGVDGISALFLPATALLLTGAILTSWNAVRTMPRVYYSLLLLEAAANLGVFCALDTIFFFLMWELAIIPIYLLVSLWGVGGNRRAAANKYALVMIAGGLPLLFGFLLLAINAGGIESSPFDVRALLKLSLSPGLQTVVFLLLLVGFGVKAPIVPLHTWFPLIAIEGPLAVTALIAGLKLGVYGLIRFALPLAPAAAVNFDWLLAGLGTLGVLYGATVALAQTNVRATLAYLGVSHVGLVLLGLSSLDSAGVQGAVLELVNFTVIVGGLFLATEWLRARTGSTSLLALGGAARRLPWLASFYLFLGLASLGLPGTSGFPSEMLILVAALDRHVGIGLAALAGITIGSACFLGLYRRSFFGPTGNPALAEAADLLPRERLVALVLTAVVLAVGLMPSLALDIIAQSAEAWLARLAP